MIICAAMALVANFLIRRYYGRTNSGSETMFKSTFAAATMGTLMLVSAAGPVQAEEAGKTPAIRCAAAVEAASRSGSVTEAATHSCQQALGWAHFVPDELGPVLSNNGVLHLIRGDYQAAIADFNAALRAGAEASSTLNDRGLAEAGLRNYQAAVDSYGQALAKATGNQERIYFNRAMAEEDIGNVKAAYLDYRKAAELAPNWPKAAAALSRFKVSHPAMV
jgi:tetratricopeptide (TPR) repeat protein